MFVGWEGRGVSKGEVRRSSGDLVLAACGGGCCGGYGWR